ncbi:MAG TPA: helix-turn-helix domain-containing protein [Streptosporangiaceae bacterium]|nr:helix-turn-helix domain-containing protein [Streptosporangiaceae bacterium]
MADGLPARGRAPNMAGPKDLGHENKVLRELVTVYRHLSGLALQNADLDTLAQLLADRTDATVAVVNEMMDVLAAGAPGVAPEQAADTVREQVVHPRLGQVLRASRQSHRALRLPRVGDMPAVIVAPILVGDEVPAHLLTFDSADKSLEDDMSLLVTEHAATISGVILGRERVVAAAARRVRDDLVEGLLLGRGREEGEAERWAAHLGYRSAREHRVLVIAFEVPPDGGGAEDADGLRQRARDSIEHFFTTRASEAIISAREDEVVVVAAEPAAGHPAETAPRRLAAVCLNRLAELFPGTKVVIGIGGGCREPREIARSYAEAHRTIETLRRLGRSGAITSFDDLGIHRLLLQVPDLMELRAFARDVLGTLSLHEREHRSEYLTTLAAYFKANSSPQRASRDLHVHPNTVAYRIKRIEEITGLHLDAYRDRLMAQVALEILTALGES